MINVWKVVAKLLFWADLYLFKQTWYIIYAQGICPATAVDMIGLSLPLHNRLPPQCKPFIFEQIAQSSHNSQHEDISLSPGFKPRNWCYTSDQQASSVTTALSELAV